MGKIIVVFILISTFSLGDNRYEASNTLEANCLSCHKKEQIPNRLMYKRYLMKYSTNARMEKAIFNYLKDPDQTNSIMPPPFFLKFSMCKKVELEDSVLRNNIKQYLEYFDLKQHIILEN